ncbi:MAG: hypothetical protein R6U95_08710 [Bacteroidales bacterium]
MKKIWILFGLIGMISLLQCSQEPHVQSDYDMFEVQGPVKSVSFYNDENVEHTKVVFRENGQILHKKQNNTFEDYIYENNILREVKKFKADMTPIHMRKYEYKDTLLAKIQQFDASGSFDNYMKYTYDEDGNNIRSELFTAYGDLQYTWRYEYNENGKKILEEHESEHKKFNRRFIYDLDDEGNIHVISEYNNANGILMKKRFYEVFHTIPLQTKMYNYWLDEISDSTLYSYSFDEYNNWIQKDVEPSQGKPSTQRRIIEYYE